MDRPERGPLVLPFRGILPRIHPSVYLAPECVLTGDIEIGEGSSIWYYVVARGDVNRIRIGRRTHVQDLSVVHVTWKTGPTTIGDDVTLGHACVVHAATIHDRSLIGMRAVVLDGAEVGPDSIVGANALVPPGMKVPAGKVAMGVPAKIVRDVTDADRRWILELGERYAVNTIPGYRD
ncbi:MAG: gamma carbonic anhydrase family protein [Deltaproteobacteria bacterium]|nr:gamma carbonic anhydrase family protein [Deltaproteobacteria bacterium]